MYTRINLFLILDIWNEIWWFFSVTDCRPPLSPSKVAIFAWKMSTVLNWMKSQFLFFELWFIVLNIYMQVYQLNFQLSPTKKECVKIVVVQKLQKVPERWAMYWKEWKINFLIFSFRDIYVYSKRCAMLWIEFFNPWIFLCDL